MEFGGFDDFFPYYVGQHSRAATLWVHFAGTVGGAATAATLAASGRPRGLLAMPLISYGAAWASHFLIEKNRPATFGHPLWSLRGDFRMIRLMASGRDHELAKLAAISAAAGPPRRAAARVEAETTPARR